jgi:hypothetical protein
MKLTIFSAFVLGLAACSSERPPAPQDAQGGSETQEAPAADAPSQLSAHTAQCGCTISSVGTCGNYIEVDGEYLPIANSAEFDLSGMQWCGQGPVAIQASGKVTDGEFHLTGIESGT